VFGSGGIRHGLAASAATAVIVGLLAAPAHADDGPPTNVGAPVVTGTAASGQVLTCSTGSWTGTPTSFTRGWLRDGLLLAGTDVASYPLTDADVGHDVGCRVRAGNSYGTSGWVASPTVAVTAGSTGPSDPPVSVDPPTIAGTAQPGGRLTCRPGTWDHRPSFTYAWRDGRDVLGSGATYDVRTADVGRQVVCTVRATNAGGTSTASSSPVTIRAAGSPDPGISRPVTACTSGSPSVVIAGGAGWTRRRTVDLRVRTPRGATRVEIADNPAFAGAVRRALSRTCSYRWDLRGRSSGAPKRVYVRFPGAADPVTPVVDTIGYDAAEPLITKAHARWRNDRHGWVLTVRAQDPESGVGWYQVSKRNGYARRTYPWRHTVVTTDRSQIERVRFFDRLGNRTGWVWVKFLT
jgi:hypothetical protein